MNPFSKYAQTYKTHAKIQEKSAKDLLALGPDNVKKILEIGCGPGNTTQTLQQHYPEATITAIDIEKNMIDTAKSQINSPKITFQNTDFQSLKHTPLDLIYSNAAIHWIPPLKSTLNKVQSLLETNGVFLFSYYCNSTFKELKVSIETVLKQPVTLPVSNFESKDTALSIIQEVFPKTQITFKQYTSLHSSLLDLLTHIQKSGTAQGTTPQINWTPKLIKEIEHTYIKQYGSIQASYDILIVKAEK